MFAFAHHLVLVIIPYLHLSMTQLSHCSANSLEKKRSKLSVINENEKVELEEPSGLEKTYMSSFWGYCFKNFNSFCQRKCFFSKSINFFLSLRSIVYKNQIISEMTGNDFSSPHPNINNNYLRNIIIIFLWRLLILEITMLLNKHQSWSLVGSKLKFIMLKKLNVFKQITLSFSG